MKKLIVGALLLLAATEASSRTTTYIFTPGKAPKVIMQTGGGYQVLDMEGGTTGVYNVGDMTAIVKDGQAQGLIMNGGGEVTPALDPNTGDVEMNLQLAPQRAMEVEYWQ